MATQLYTEETRKCTAIWRTEADSNVWMPMDWRSPRQPAADELLAVNDALDRLASADPAKAELVKLRYFVGMTIEEAAAAPGIPEPTAKRRWSLALACLFNEIGRDRRLLYGALLHSALFQLVSVQGRLLH